MSDVIPPPPAPRGPGCWKWTAIGCGSGCAVVVVVCVLAVFAAWPRIQKTFGAWQQTSDEAKQCEAQMEVVGKALESYRRAKGGYPDRLEQLVPKFIARKEDLRVPPTPDGKAFLYHRPAKDAAPSTPVLEYVVVLRQPNATISIPVILQKDGKVISGDIGMQTGRPSPIVPPIESAPTGKPGTKR